jgi:hypothetical protein
MNALESAAYCGHAVTDRFAAATCAPGRAVLQRTQPPDMLPELCLHRDGTEKLRLYRYVGKNTETGMPLLQVVISK